MTFRNNKASDAGGAIYCENNCNLVHNESKITFINNTPKDGGAVKVSINCGMILGKAAVAVFINNTATEFVGALYISENSNVICDANSNVTFGFNSAVTWWRIIRILFL